ncbi:winged helix-turn-helix transcriptional regulator [Accumulibacter sp.]|nr:winged helix-turn-helix transcriptional regulator [Accumulibacter sp.]
MTPTDQVQLHILKIVEETAEISQRQLAERLESAWARSTTC